MEIENLTMNCSSNNGYIIDFCEKKPGDYRYESNRDYKKEVFTKWSEASKRFKELADMMYKEKES